MVYPPEEDDTDAVLKRTTSLLRDVDHNKCYGDAIAKLIDNSRRVQSICSSIAVRISSGPGTSSFLRQPCSRNIDPALYLRKRLVQLVIVLGLAPT